MRVSHADRSDHADRVSIGLPCGQGQLSRIWKVQRDWLSVAKECCPLLSRRLWGGKKYELPAWEASFESDSFSNPELAYWFSQSLVFI